MGDIFIINRGSSSARRTQSHGSNNGRCIDCDNFRYDGYTLAGGTCKHIGEFTWIDPNHICNINKFRPKNR